MKRKKILYIITKSFWGGAGKYVYDLAINADKNYYDVFVAAGGKEELAKKIIDADIPYFEIKNFQRDTNFIKDILAYFEVLLLLFKIKPDIIHVNSSKAGGIVGVASFDYRLLSFKFNLKTIFTAHGWAFHEERSSIQIFLIKIFTKIMAFFYSKIICVSEYDRLSAVENKIIPQKKLITIHNGLDYENIFFIDREKAQRRLMNKTSSFVMGSVAEWTKNKGLFYLLKALQKINIDNFDVILIGSGQNSDKEKMFNFINENNIKNIYLHEWIPNAVSYFKSFDIFVLPSIKEGLPYCLLEAGFAKLPVISTRVGGIPEIIENEREGVLIDAADINQLVGAIEELIRNEEKREKISFNLQNKIIEKFSLKKMLISTLSVYEKD